MKAVFFDFDGTLTQQGSNIWKSIWKELGYDIGENSEYSRQLNAYLNGDITHQDWCNQTLKSFQDKGMTVNILNKVAERVNLINGVYETLKILKENGYALHIISGNIISVIKLVLGRYVEYFDSINANDFCFNQSGKLTYIRGTNYDFEGKAKFIEEYKKLTGVSNEDIYFVGNGNNDVWAYLSGCHTICINPDNDESKNFDVWHTVINKTNDLRDILKFILNNN